MTVLVDAMRYLEGGCGLLREELLSIELAVIPEREFCSYVEDELQRQAYPS